MLAADKSALAKELSQQMLELQWKELQYLYQNAQNLSFTSAVLVGFGFLSSGIIGVQAYHTENNIWQHAYSWTAQHIAGMVAEGFIGLTLALAMSYNLITLFNTTVTSMAGPGLALRGPEGSVERAVRSMEQQNKDALRYFGRGLSSFTLHLSAVGVRSLSLIHI
eukprot:1669413-Prymnesium_polylepis.1